ncbi:MAG: hypothetical protein AAF388_15720 [Bacteroidota bacterium]
MNLHSLPLLLLSTLLVFLGSSLHAQKILSEDALSPETFSVHIWQEGEMISEKEGSYLLEKKPFTLVFTWERKKVDGVYTFADTDPVLFNLPEESTIPFVNELYVVTLADREFNPNKVLFLSDSIGVNFFSDPSRGSNNYSRFNKLESSMDTFTGYREVEAIQTREKHYDLLDMREPVYLLCFATNTFEDQDKNGVHVLKRMKLKITWK